MFAIPWTLVSCGVHLKEVPRLLNAICFGLGMLSYCSNELVSLDKVYHVRTQVSSRFLEKFLLLEQKINIGTS